MWGWLAALLAAAALAAAPAGAQATASTRLAERAVLGLGYRFTPGTEVGAVAGVANVAGAGTVSVGGYRARTLQLRARVRI